MTVAQAGGDGPRRNPREERRIDRAAATEQRQRRESGPCGVCVLRVLPVGPELGAPGGVEEPQVGRRSPTDNTVDRRINGFHLHKAPQHEAGVERIAPLEARTITVGKPSIGGLRSDGALDRPPDSIAGHRVVAEPKVNAQCTEEVGVVDVHIARRVVRKEPARLGPQIFKDPLRSRRRPSMQVCLVRRRCAVKEALDCERCDHDIRAAGRVEAPARLHIERVPPSDRTGGVIGIEERQGVQSKRRGGSVAGMRQPHSRRSRTSPAPWRFWGAPVGRAGECRTARAREPERWPDAVDGPRSSRPATERTTRHKGPAPANPAAPPAPGAQRPSLRRQRRGPGAIEASDGVTIRELALTRRVTGRPRHDSAASEVGVQQTSDHALGGRAIPSGRHLVLVDSAPAQSDPGTSLIRSRRET